jgi:hypothetical protein
MPKRNKQSKTKSLKRPKDVNQLAHYLGRQSTGEEPQKHADRPNATSEEIRRVMSVLGARGGKVGGKRRAERMTEEQRSDAAARAANARWHPTPPER